MSIARNDIHPTLLGLCKELAERRLERYEPNDPLAQIERETIAEIDTRLQESRKAAKNHTREE